MNELLEKLSNARGVAGQEGEVRAILREELTPHVDTQGFCRFTTVGGVLTNTLIGSRVHFANGVEGAFGMEGSPFARERTTPQKMFLDVGTSAREDERVQVGDMAVLRSSFGAVGDRLFAPHLDDRIGTVARDD